MNASFVNPWTSKLLCIVTTRIPFWASRVKNLNKRFGPKAKVLRCCHRHALRGRWGSTSLGGGGVDFGPYLVDTKGLIKPEPWSAPILLPRLFERQRSKHGTNCTSQISNSHVECIHLELMAFAKSGPPEKRKTFWHEHFVCAFLRANAVNFSKSIPELYKECIHCTQNYQYSRQFCTAEGTSYTNSQHSAIKRKAVQH